MTGLRLRRRQPTRPASVARPAPSRVPLPGYVSHGDSAVEAVLVAAFLANEFGLDPVSLSWHALRPLSADESRPALEWMSLDMNEAARVADCRDRAEFEDITGVHSRSLSLADDIEHHVATVQADFRLNAERLVERARRARQERAS